MALKEGAAGVEASVRMAGRVVSHLLTNVLTFP